MRLRQIRHVDIIANAGPVSRVIVVAEDADAWPIARNRVKHERDEVGFGIMRLADFALRIRAGGVKISLRHPRNPMRALKISQHPLDHPF